MPTILIISLFGFFVCLVLLFYFIAKYRSYGPKEQEIDLDLLDEVSSAATVAAQDARRIFGKGGAVSAREAAEIKEKLKELHYKIEEIKLVEEKRNLALSKAISKIEQRINTFEDEYVNKLQPTLFNLIKELENMEHSQTGQ